MARTKNYFHRFRSTSGSEAPAIPPSAGITATGGTIVEPGNGFKYHFFTSSGSLVVSAITGPGIINYLLVGGGGAGGNYPSGNSGGGGGAGGFVTNTSTLTVNTYPVTIGEGGAANSNPGSHTIFNSITAYGGGGGSPSYTSPGNPGASGGGGGGAGPTTGGVGNKIQPGGADIPEPLQPQGNNGGRGGPADNSGRSGGGGGAGAAGQDAGGYNPGKSGAGGEGKSAFDGDTGIPTDYGTAHPSQPGRWFAGGGAGGGYPSAAINTEPGGIGGGGSSLTGVPLNGVDGTGGGGGGGQGGAGDGGDGIVIIRYSL